ncbi:metallophosphoesterase [uncultured Metabacillus sp.]|uniref:metallophosphoesterase n=1 Tax=uncultured Metabacillus sp. TaxID=2860135 RepID=UPI00262DC8D8|nr:metallophosphoesterase [uncultured Metabacillus sp.]
MANEFEFQDEQIESKEKKFTRRKFLEGTTKVAGLSLGMALVNPMSNLTVFAADDKEKGDHRNKPILVFPVISDVHIKKTGTKDIQKFSNTLQQLNEVVPKQDAFVVVGDLTDNGFTEEYDRFMSVYNAGKQPQAVSLMAIGNHDYWNGLSVADAQKLFFKKTGMESIYFHKVIKGYHFIILGTEDGNTEGTFSVKQINWLGEKLKQAKAEDPKKPIFVFHHQPIKDTIYGSEWGFSENRDLFYNTLKEYPQAITFSGHTHYPLDDPRIIHQKDFTTVGTSTGSYIWLDAGRIQGEVPEGADFLNQALIVEVYYNKVIIKRRDIHNNDWTGEPFVISSPADKNKFLYTEKRADKTAPYFEKDAKLTIVQPTLTGLTIAFSQAKDNLLVHDYKIVARNLGTGKAEKEFLAFSEFYKDFVPNPLVLNLEGLKPNTKYELEVQALDAYGNGSKTSLKATGKTLQGEVEEVSITLSKDSLNGTADTVEVTVENARVPQSDWIGLYEVNEEPGGPASIWWMYTKVENGTFKVTYNPKDNKYPDRYKEGSTYKFVYFYGSGYDAVASATFTVGSKG